MKFIENCECCGKQVRQKYGYEIRYSRYGNFLRSRNRLCAKCANKIIPIIDDALKKIYEVRDSIEYNYEGSLESADEIEIVINDKFELA